MLENYSKKKRNVKHQTSNDKFTFKRRTSECHVTNITFVFVQLFMI